MLAACARGSRALSIERFVVDDPAPTRKSGIRSLAGPMSGALAPDPGDRARRHGPRLRRRAHRRPVSARGGGQAHAGRPARPLCHRALPHRAPGAGVAQASQHRRPAGRRARARRHALPRDGARGRRPHHRLVSQPAPVPRGAPRPLPRRVRRRPARASGAGRPPRPQAVEHPRVDGGRREAPGLRHRQAPRARGVGNRAPPRRSTEMRALTPDYAAPEQWRRRAHHHRHRRVRAGGLLYELVDRCSSPGSGGNP